MKSQGKRPLPVIGTPLPGKTERWQFVYCEKILGWKPVQPERYFSYCGSIALKLLEMRPAHLVELKYERLQSIWKHPENVRGSATAAQRPAQNSPRHGRVQNPGQKDHRGKHWTDR